MISFDEYLVYLHMSSKYALIFIFFSSIIFSNAIATLVRVDGAVYYRRANIDTFTQIIDGGFKIYNEDEIKVGKNSFAAAIYLDNRSVVKIMEDTEILFLDNSNSDKIKLHYGTLVNNINREHRKKDFTIITPKHIASVKGTQFAITVRKNGFEKFICKIGKIEIQDMKNRQTIILDEWQKALKSSSDNLRKVAAKEYDYPQAPSIEYIYKGSRNIKTRKKNSISKFIENYKKGVKNKIKNDSNKNSSTKSKNNKREDIENSIQDKSWKRNTEQKKIIKIEEKEFKSNPKNKSSD